MWSCAYFGYSKMGEISFKNCSNTCFYSFNHKSIRQRNSHLTSQAIWYSSQRQKKYFCRTDWLPKCRKEFSHQRNYEKSMLQGCSYPWRNQNLAIYYINKKNLLSRLSWYRSWWASNRNRKSFKKCRQSRKVTWPNNLYLSNFRQSWSQTYLWYLWCCWMGRQRRFLKKGCFENW